MSETIEVGLLAAGAAIAGGILSGIYQHFRDWFTRPKLVIEFHENGPANVVQASWDVGGRQVEWVIVRPGIRNRGRRPATNCRVFLISLSEVHSKSDGNRIRRLNAFTVVRLGFQSKNVAATGRHRILPGYCESSEGCSGMGFYVSAAIVQS